MFKGNSNDAKKQQQQQPQQQPPPQQSGSRFTMIFSRNKSTTSAGLKKPEIIASKSDPKGYEYSILNKFNTSSTFKYKIERSLDSMNTFNNTYSFIEGKMVADLYKDYTKISGEFQKQETKIKELSTVKEENKALAEQLQALRLEHETMKKDYELKIQQLTPVVSAEELVSRTLEQVNQLHDHEKSLLNLEVSSLKQVKTFAKYCQNLAFSGVE